MPQNLRKAAEKRSISIDYHLRGQTLSLLPERAIFWQEKRYLLLSDVHLGKAGHFRKHGAPIPATVHSKDLAMLTDVIARWRPEVLVILGDLFHSDLNNEWLDFEAWLHRHRTLSVVLVKGNHDILPEAVYQHPNLAVHPEAWAVDPFLLTHEPVVEAVQRRGGLSFPPTASVSRYNLAGHIHPGVYVGAGMGERVKLPCFYFTSQLGILPAFGQFTGCATVRPQPDDQVFAVVSPQRVLAIRQ